MKTKAVMEPGESRSLCIWSTVDEVRRAARFCRTAVDGLFPADEIDRIELAVVEAGNNVVEHAYGGDPTGRIWVNILCHVDRVEIQFEDETQTVFETQPRVRSVEPPSGPEDVPERGWGLFIMHSVMDDVRLVSGDNRVRLVLTKYFRNPADADGDDSGRDHLAHAPRAVRHPATEETVQRLRRILQESEATITEMTAELNSAYETLALLFSLNRELNIFGDETTLRRTLLQRTVENVGAAWGVLRLLRGRHLVLAAYTSNAPPPECVPRIPVRIDPETNTAVIEEAMLFLPDGTPVLRIPLRAHNDVIGRIDLGGRAEDEAAPEFLSSELKLAQALADHAAMVFQHRSLYQDAVRLEVARHEVELARGLMTRLLPERPGRIPRVPGVRAMVRIETASEVGGDYVGFARPADGRLLFAVADVMGKGTPAAFLSAMVHTAFQAAAAETLSPAKVLDRMNHILFDDLDSLDTYVTVLTGMVDPEARRFLYASAGHCPVIVQDAPGDVSLLADGDVMLGISRDTGFGEFEVPLQTGTRLFAFTDGLTDIVSSSGERLGVEPVLRLVRHNRRKRLAGAVDRLVRYAARYSHGKLQDDVAVVGIEMTDAGTAGTA